MNRKRTAESAGSVALGAWAAFAVLALVVAGRHGAPLGMDRALLAAQEHTTGGLGLLADS
ncbi:hypothetical protein ABZ372_41715 [Streptomyces sp. NPDC005921]